MNVLVPSTLKPVSNTFILKYIYILFFKKNTDIHILFFFPLHLVLLRAHFKKQQLNLTNRYYEKDSQINDQHQQQIKSHHNKYEFDLERDHALPTSAPNADILKSNNNPTYPNPNRHHNHNHRHQNATPSPQGNDYVSIFNDLLIFGLLLS